jgi:hypothetical protein
MSAVKNWHVGERVVSLRTNRAVLLSDNGHQCTLATSRAGLLALVEALKECADEMREPREDDGT